MMPTVCTRRRMAWLQQESPPIPPCYQLLYDGCEISTNRSWAIFRKYLPTLNSIAIHQPESPHDYIFKTSSLNGSRDRMKEFSSKQIKSKVFFNDTVTPPQIQEVLPALLDPRSSMALMTMHEPATRSSPHEEPHIPNRSPTHASPPHHQQYH